MAIVFDDSFAGAADTSYATGVKAVGSITSVAIDYGSNALELNGSGQLRQNGTGSSRARAVTNVRSASGTVILDVVTGGAGAESSANVLFRCESSGTGYVLRVLNGTAGIAVEQYTGYSSDDVLFTDTEFVAATAYQITLTFSGSTFKLYRGLTELGTVTDTTFASANTDIEFWLENSGNSSQTLIDRVRVSNTVDVPGAPPPTTSFFRTGLSLGFGLR
jgi:hypothetical protein